MTYMLIAHGANEAKFPVTAFDDVESAQETINSLDAPIDVNDVGDVEMPFTLEAAHEVAEAVWDGYYFMGDPPMKYELMETNGEVGLFMVSDD